MLTRDLRRRLAVLTDELLADQGVEAAFLASILLRAQDALSDGTIATLGLRLWRSDPDPEVGRLQPDSGGPPWAEVCDSADPVEDQSKGSRKGRVRRTSANLPRRRTGGA